MKISVFPICQNNITQAWDIGKYLEMVKAREKEIYRSNHCEKQLYRIISTALENSSKTPHWWSSVRMLQTNPDFFNFILGILWSHLEVAANVAVIVSIANNHILVSVCKQIYDQWSMIKKQDKKTLSVWNRSRKSISANGRLSKNMIKEVLIVDHVKPVTVEENHKL